MYLVDDINGVLTDLRRNTHLINERTDVLNRVVRRRIEFVDVKRTLLVKGLATLALVTCIKTVLRVKTVDGLSEDTGASGLTYSTRTAKQVRMRQMILANRVLQVLSR